MDAKHWNSNLQEGQRINRDVSKLTFNTQFIYSHVQLWHIVYTACFLQVASDQIPIYKYKLVLYITYQLLVWTDLRETSCKHWLFQVISLQSTCPGSRMKRKKIPLYSFQNIPFCVLYIVRIRLLKVDGYAAGAEVLLFIQMITWTHRLKNVLEGNAILLSAFVQLSIISLWKYLFFAFSL